VGGVAQFGAELLEQGHVAAAPVAEAEAFADADGAQRADVTSELPDEVFAAPGGKLGRERHHHGGPAAEGSDSPEALWHSLQQAGSPGRIDDCERMRVEREGHRPGAEVGGIQQGGADDVLMPQMHAVKHVQGHARAAGRRGQFWQLAGDQHAQFGTADGFSAGRVECLSWDGAGAIDDGRYS
jgi:hypothetical protein